MNSQKPRRSRRSSQLGVALVAAAAVLVILFAFRSRPLAPEVTEPIAIEARDPEPRNSIIELPEIADAEIELSLAELCSSEETKSETDTQSQEETLAQIEELNNMLRNVKERLIDSPEAEHLHMAALFETKPSVRVELVSRALVTNPNDAYLVWDAVRICADALDQSNCPLGAWEDKLLAIDGQNSESWIRIATNRYLEDDIDAAYRGMQRAATAAESRAYWTESIEMIERGFAAGSDYAFAERATAAFGIAASKLPDYGAYLTMCKEQSAISTDWAYVCLAYGELVEKQGKTDMGQAIARSIQLQALKVIGDEEMLKAVTARQKQHRQSLSSSLNRYNLLAEKLMVSNPAMFSGYLAAVRAHGEFSARAYLREETDRWLKQHEDSDCVP